MINVNTTRPQTMMKDRQKKTRPRKRQANVMAYRILWLPKMTIPVRTSPRAATKWSLAVSLRTRTTRSMRARRRKTHTSLGYHLHNELRPRKNLWL